jgi:hypothetical protein
MCLYAEDSRLHIDELPLTLQYGEAAISQTEREPVITLWRGREARILHSIVGVYSAMKVPCPHPLSQYQDHAHAYATLAELLRRTPGCPHLLSAMGRVLLQAGDNGGAAEYAFGDSRIYTPLKLRF